MKKILTIITAIALLFSVLSGCSGKQKEAEIIKHNIAYNTIQQVGTLKSSVTEYELVDQNEYVALYFDNTNCYVYVEDKRTGKLWSSNPAESSSANEQSQILLSVRDKSGTQTNYASYTDAVAKNQFEYDISSGKLAVTYTIGYASDLLAKTPLGFSGDRFEEILERCDKKQKSLLKKRYTKNKDSGYYERKDFLTQDQTKKLVELFDGIGYTEAELKKDNANFSGTLSDAKNSSFVVTLNYNIEQDSLVYSINVSEMETTQGYAIEKMSVLPYFGCISSKADGYIFVPDGSGAIIDTQPAFEASGIFSAPIYGQDRNYSLNAEVNSSKPVLLPVYGINRGNDGILSIIEEGKAIAGINASKPGITGEVAFAYTSYALDVVQDLSVVGNASSKYVASSTKRYDGEIRQRYVFLTESYCDYSSMAVIYRNYLSQNGVLNKLLENQDVAFHLETIGTMTDETSTLGVVHETDLPLTKYEDNITLLKKLEDKNVKNIKLILKAWFNGGNDQKLADSIKTIDSLGGNSAFEKLIKYCDEENIGVYPTVLLNSFSKTQTIKSNKYASVDLAYNKVYLENYDMVTGKEMDSQFNQIRLVLSPRYSYGVASSFLKKYTADYKTGLTLGDVSSTIYSDMRKSDTVLRSEALNISENIIRDYSEKIDLMLFAPNDVASAYASYYTDVPDSNSSYLCESYSVPFYQMVYHGYSEYSFSALNQTSDIKREVLKCIEYGAVPKFTWVYRGDLIMANPQRAELYYADYTQWLDDAVKAYKEINALLSDVRGCTIEKHSEIADNVFKTTYSDGTSIYVNYNDFEVTADGVTIGSVSAEKGGN